MLWIRQHKQIQVYFCCMWEWGIRPRWCLLFSSSWLQNSQPTVQRCETEALRRQTFKLPNCVPNWKLQQTVFIEVLKYLRRSFWNEILAFELNRRLCDWKEVVKYGIGPYQGRWTNMVSITVKSYLHIQEGRNIWDFLRGRSFCLCIK